VNALFDLLDHHMAGRVEGVEGDGMLHGRGRLPQRLEEHEGHKG
jgi:hypothetical protein